ATFVFLTSAKLRVTKSIETQIALYKFRFNPFSLMGYFPFDEETLPFVIATELEMPNNGRLSCLQTTLFSTQREPPAAPMTKVELPHLQRPSAGDVPGTALTTALTGSVHGTNCLIDGCLLQVQCMVFSLCRQDTPVRKVTIIFRPGAEVRRHFTDCGI